MHFAPYKTSQMRLPMYSEIDSSLMSTIEPSAVRGQFFDGRRSALAAAVMACVCGIANAGALLQLEIRDGSVGDPNLYHPEPITVSDSLSFGGGSASGYANLATGVLKAGGTAPARAYGLGNYYAFADSSFSDTVTFGPMASGIGYLDFHWDGTLPSFDGMAQSVGRLGVYIASPGPTVVDPAFVLNNDNCYSYTLPEGSICTAGTSIDQTVSVPFDITPGPTYFQLDLLAYPWDGGTANFLNTANFALRLPDGVTYTSASGQFLADAPSIVGSATNNVPEPGALFPLGLGALFALMRRERSGELRRK